VEGYATSPVGKLGNADPRDALSILDVHARTFGRMKQGNTILTVLVIQVQTHITVADTEFCNNNSGFVNKLDGLNSERLPVGQGAHQKDNCAKQGNDEHQPVSGFQPFKLFF